MYALRIHFLEGSYEWDSQLLTKLDNWGLAVVIGVCILSITLHDHTSLFHKRESTLVITPITAPSPIWCLDANDFLTTQDQDLDPQIPFTAPSLPSFAAKILWFSGSLS